MKVIVDLNVCQGHGECSRIAPDLFQLGTDLSLTWVEFPEEERRSDIVEATSACPTQAISISDEN